MLGYRDCGKYTGADAVGWIDWGRYAVMDNLGKYIGLCRLGKVHNVDQDR